MPAGSPSALTSPSVIGGGRSYVVDLRSVTGVSIYLQSRRFHHAFTVERSDGHPIIFGAESDLEMRGWLTAIKLLADKVRLSGNDGGDDCDGGPMPCIANGGKSRNPSCPPRMAREVNVIRREAAAAAVATSLLAGSRSTPQLHSTVSCDSSSNLARLIRRQVALDYCSSSAGGTPPDPGAVVCICTSLYAFCSVCI